MKKILSFLALSLVIISGLFAQSPQKFTYQAVVRDSYNTLVPSKPVGVRISILQGGLSGPVVYSEQHSIVTNANGLMTLQIGDGLVLGGDFSAIDWAAGPYFLKTETDPQGGTNYTVTGAQQLLSVPYALYSEKSADSFSGDYNDLTHTPTIPTTTGELTNDAGFITTADIPDSVSAFINDALYITRDSIPTNVSAFTNDALYITRDSIPTNVSAFTNDAGYLTSFTEVQALSISNDTIFLTNGGFVKLPAGFDGDYNSLTNKPNIPTSTNDLTNNSGFITKDSIPTNVSAFTNDALYITRDSIPTNVSAFTNDAGYLTSFTEIQALSISHDTIFLTNGGFVKLPAGFDGDYNSLTNKPNIPTSTNDLTNNSGFITKDSIPTNVSAFTNDALYITRDSIPTNVSAFTNDAGYLTSFTEVQALSINNDTIFLTNGGFVKLPAGFDGDYNSLTNKPNIPTSTNDLTNNSGFITKDSIPTNVSAFTNDALYITRDSIPTNVSAFTNDAGYLTSFTEVQALSISHDTIFLTNGGFVKLPAGFDGDYNSLTNKPNIPTSTNDLTNNSGFITKDSIPTNVSAFINDALYITRDSIPTNVSAFTNDAGYLTSFTEVQALSISNDTIFLTNGGFVKLPAGFDGDYNSLTNKPNIPTTTNDLPNNSGFITKDSIPTNVSAFTNDAGYITKDSIPNTVSTFINDANYITKDSIPTNVSAFANDAGYLTKDSICAATAPCGYLTSADLNFFLEQINDKIDSLNQIFTYEIDSLKTIINTQAEKIDSLSGYVNNGYTPWDSTGLNPNDAKPCPGVPTVSDVDNNVYNTVQIGSQCWMRENLRTTKYSDNTPIGQGSTTSTEVAYWYYSNNDSSNKQTYGLLYNWKAVMRNASSSNANPSGVQGICPTGWHVPSDAEWTELTDYVSSQSQYVCASTSSYIARSLAGQIGWNSSTVTCTVGQYVSDNNATGFSALPAGYASSIYYNFGDVADFWSSTEYGSTDAYYRSLFYADAYVVSTHRFKSRCYSVRCLKD